MKANNEFFEQFDDIYENKDKYNLTWAFRDAQEKLDDYRVQVIDVELKSKCILCKNKRTANKNYAELKLKSVSHRRKHRFFSSVFDNANNFLSIFEFLLSFLLVILISEISHSGEEIVLTKAFSAYVFIIFAFIKVVLEQFILRPKMEHLGWKMYKKSVNRLKGLAKDFDEQLNGDLLEVEV